MDDAMRDRRDQARWIILLASLAGAIYLCWLMLKPFVAVLLWSAVLAVAFEPLHTRILRRTRRPNLSAALSCLLMLLFFGVPTAMIGWAVIQEIRPAVADLQTGLTDLLNPNSEISGPAIRWLEAHVDMPKIRGEIDAKLGDAGTWVASRSFDIVGGVLSVLVQMLFVLFVTYYLFRDGRQVREALSSVIPLRHRQTYAIFMRTREVIAASLYGSLVIAAIQGALGGLAFWVLGIPGAILWGIVMIFFSLIPLAGAFVVWIPAAIYLAMTGAWIKALILTFWGSVVIGLIDNFLRPKLVGGRAKLHEILIFFAVLGGLQVFGLLGIVLGPVVLAIALALLDAFRHPELSAGPPTILPADTTLPPL